MDLNFNISPGFNLCRYEKYEIKEINKRKYIIPISENNSIKYSEGYIPNMLIDLLNIGRYFNMFDDITVEQENEIIKFANNYGLLGLINALPVNQLFFLDDTIVLNDHDYLETLKTETVLSKEKYFELFFPTFSKSEIKDLIKQATDISTSNNGMHQITKDINSLFLGNIGYAEPLDLIIDYASNMYYIFNSIDEGELGFPFLTNFNVNHLNFNFMEFDENIYVHTPIKYLKQVLDLHFSAILSQKTLLLKACKHCGKIFLAKNPKAEYDTPQCKNQANVYKSREKNK
jgi:hypothetical protein